MARMKYVKRNDGVSIPRRLICVDCEAYINDNAGEDSHEVQTFRLACAKSCRIRGSIVSDIRFSSFDRPQAFWKWVDSLTVSRGTTWIVAHNLAYDLTLLGLWGQVIAKRYSFSGWYESASKTAANANDNNDRLPMVVLSDPPTIIGLINRQGHKIICVDSLNYWRCSLAKMGESIGYSKWTLPQQHESYQRWLEYCQRDVEILFRSMIKLIRWWQSGDLGNWAFTTPSLAMHAFRHRFKHYEIAAHDEKEIRTLERSSYYGGRVEAYWIGRISGPCYQIDVNSLYPAMMQNMELPTILWDWNHTDDFTTKPPQYDLHSVCAEVAIISPNANYPLRTTKGVIYPRGTFVTTLAGPELAMAYESGRIIAWGSWAHYVMKPIFKEYVSYFWALKHQAEQDGNFANAELAKMMLNGLVGKFGQRSSRWERLTDREPIYEFGERIDRNIATGKREHLLFLYNHTFLKMPEGELSKSIPAIPAWINSAARVFLVSTFNKAGIEHIYYCSTDALIVDSIGFDRLFNAGMVEDSTLGKFRVKHIGISGHIGGIHNYRVGNHAVFGGAPLGANVDAYGRWEHTQFPGIQEIIAKGGQATIRVERYMKGLRNAYDRRRRVSEYETEPWDFSELPNAFEIVGFRQLLGNAR